MVRVLFALLACSSCYTSDVVIEHAQADLRCRKEIDMEHQCHGLAGGEIYQARGCGERAYYLCTHSGAYDFRRPRCYKLEIDRALSDCARGAE